MIITISGKQGAGKTTLAKMLAKKFNYKFISIGDLRGQIAMEKGITIDKLNEIGKKESWVHKEADRKTIEIGKTKDNFVVEGWLAYYFIPNSKKIFFDVNEKTGAERIFKSQRPDEKECKNLEETKIMLKKRLNETREQFKKYYAQDFLNKNNYDLIIDTTKLNTRQVLNKILDELKK